MPGRLLHRLPCAAYAPILPLLPLACSSGELHVPPPETTLATVILARQSGTEGSWQITRHASTETSATKVSDSDVVYFIGYEQSAEALGLVGAGPPDCAVRKPELVALLAAADGGWSWREVPVAPTSLLDTLVGSAARCNPCAPISMRGVVARQVHRYSGAGWFEDGALFAASPVFHARIDADQIEDLPVCAGLDLVTDSMIGLGDDRFLLGGALGELAVVRLSERGRACVVETSTRAPLGTLDTRVAGFDALAANPESPGDFDFYALRANGDLHHWTERGLRLLASLPSHPEAESADPTSILRLDARRALISAGWNQVSHFEDEALVHTEVLPLPTSRVSNSPGDRLTMLSLDARLGRYLAGTKMGAIWARDIDGGSWQPVFQSPILEAVGTIIELSDRYLVTIDGGDVVSWDFEGGVCPEVQRIPMASNGSRCRYALRRDDEIALVDAIGSSASFAGVVWIETEVQSDP